MKVEPRPDDMFALGFFRAARRAKAPRTIRIFAINSVETISTAFIAGLTVGCAKCHDHMYDPIKQRDFYAMKALFDPLAPRKITLATATDLFNSGKAMEEDRRSAARKSRNQWPEKLIAPYKKKPYDERVTMPATRNPNRHLEAGKGTHYRGTENRR